MLKCCIAKALTMYYICIDERYVCLDEAQKCCKIIFGIGPFLKRSDYSSINLVSSKSPFKDGYGTLPEVAIAGHVS
jgi:hypothetical protein